MVHLQQRKTTASDTTKSDTGVEEFSYSDAWKEVNGTLLDAIDEFGIHHDVCEKIKGASDEFDENVTCKDYLIPLLEFASKAAQAIFHEKMSPKSFLEAFEIVHDRGDDEELSDGFIRTCVIGTIYLESRYHVYNALDKLVKEWMDGRHIPSYDKFKQRVLDQSKES